MRLSSHRRSAAWVASAAATVAAVVLAAGCSSQRHDSGPTPAAASRSSTTAAGPQLTLAVFTDSWGAGSHCGGCTPWAAQLGPDYEKADGVRVKVLNFAIPGASNTDSLLKDLQTDARYRAAVSAADVVVFNQGVNDFDQFDSAVFAQARQGTCGGEDGTACLAPLVDHWTTNLDQFASVVTKLRGGKPTALRFVGVSNEYLGDPGLPPILGGKEVAQAVFADFNDISCAVATRHGGACVDLRPVLNGKDEDAAADPNTPRSMRAVATAVVAVGLPELDLS